MNQIDKIYDDIKTLSIDKIEKYIESNNNNKITIETLLFIIYDVHKYNPTGKLVEQQTKRQFQSKFKKQLEKTYKKCVISNRDMDLCEACHIIPFSESNNAQMYDVNNGLLLSSDLHKLFDKYNLSINETGKVVLSDDILIKKSYSDYHKYDGIQLKLNSETLKNLKVHYNKYLEINKCQIK